MLTTGLFTIHRTEVKVKIGKPFKIIPFGDVHRDSNLHASKSWNEFLAYAKKQDNALFLGMGDYSDGISTSERIVLSDQKLHETTRSNLSDVYKGVTKTLANELSFMRGKMIGLIGGNHYFQFDDGNTTDHLLAAALQTKFLGVCSIIRLSINYSDNPKHSRCIDIFAHHGKGGGNTPGGQFNTIEKMLSGCDADIYLMGHSHGKGCIPSTPRIKIATSNTDKKLTVIERTPWLGRTGSFLKAYEPGMVSYNVDAGRSPLALGWIEFEITVLRDQSNDRDTTRVQIRGTS